MPPKSDLDYSILKFMYKDSDGKLHEMNPIGTAEVIEDPKWENPYSKLLQPVEMNLTMCIHTKYAKGMFDCLCGWRWTRAARRFLRLVARHKEKERREKLKEVKAHENH